MGGCEMTMSERERQLAVLNGQSPDRVPWMPRLDLWYKAHYLAGTLPPEFEGKRLGDIQTALGVGKAARTGYVCTSRIRGVEIVERRKGMETVTEYVTPVGTVSRMHKRTDGMDRNGIGALEVEHLIKGSDDYGPVTYIIENTEYYPAYEQFEAYDKDVGDLGLPIVQIGDVPFHSFLKDLTGYERGYLQLFDSPGKVERLLQTMGQCLKERMWPVMAESPATVILHGAHFSSQTTPAVYFDRYMLPYMQEFADFMHAHGKKVAHHADNDTSQILKQLKDSRYDMQECFVTSPMVPCTLKQAREELGDDVVIFGGIPSVILEPSVSDQQFEEYMDDLFRVIAPGDAIILGVADNVMPTSLISRVRRIGELVEERGSYPVSA